MKKFIFIVLASLSFLILLPIVLWLICQLLIGFNFLIKIYVDYIDLFFNNFLVSETIAIFTIVIVFFTCIFLIKELIFDK